MEEESAELSADPFADSSNDVGTASGDLRKDG